jgi:hypothetical protein
VRANYKIPSPLAGEVPTIFPLPRRERVVVRGNIPLPSLNPIHETRYPAAPLQSKQSQYKPRIAGERRKTMAVLKEGGVPIGRFMIINKTDGLTQDDLIIEANGQYKILEKPDAFLIKNDECCKSIMVKVIKKD